MEEWRVRIAFVVLYVVVLVMIWSSGFRVCDLRCQETREAAGNLNAVAMESAHRLGRMLDGAEPESAYHDPRAGDAGIPDHDRDRYPSGQPQREQRRAHNPTRQR